MRVRPISKTHAALTNLAVGLAAECARSRDYGLLDLLPRFRCPVAYWYDDTSYVVHPDGSFILDLHGGHRQCLLEYERRGTTPRRVRARLENYRRYFQSSYARRDHGGDLPRCFSCSRPPTTRTPSKTPPPASIMRPPPAPTWRP